MSADGGRGHVHARERDRDRDRAPAPTPAASREAPSQPETATAPMTPISFAKAFGWGAGAGAGGTAPTPPPTPPPSPLGRPVAASDSAPERAADAAEARQRGAPDLTGVRVHTDARADGYARSLGADALTLGQDIFVARAAWNPGSAATNALLAHELHHAHHGQAGVVYRKPGSSRASDEVVRIEVDVPGSTDIQGAPAATAGGPYEGRLVLASGGTVDIEVTGRLGAGESAVSVRPELDSPIIGDSVDGLQVRTKGHSPLSHYRFGFSTLLSVAPADERPPICSEGRSPDSTRAAKARDRHPATAPQPSDEVALAEFTNAEVASMTTTDRMIATLPRLSKTLGADAVAKLQAVFTTENLAIFIAFLAASVGLQWSPVGWAEDAVAVAGGVMLVAWLGPDAITAIECFYQWYRTCEQANQDSDLDAAAASLSQGLAIVTVDALAVFVMQRASTAVRGVAGPPGGEPGGSAAAPGEGASSGRPGSGAIRALVVKAGMGGEYPGLPVDPILEPSGSPSALEAAAPSGQSGGDGSPAPEPVPAPAELPKGAAAPDPLSLDAGTTPEWSTVQPAPETPILVVTGAEPPAGTGSVLEAPKVEAPAGQTSGARTQSGAGDVSAGTRAPDPDRESVKLPESEEGTRAGGKSAKPYSDPKQRPKYGKGQVEDVWKAAQQPDGRVYDPNTGEELTWDPSRPRTGQWDMGHVPGEEYRKLHKDYMDGKIDLGEFLRRYRDPGNYRPEAPDANQSHLYEED